MRKLFIVVSVLLCSVFGSAAAAAPEVPTNIFQWVQSSARTDYYFNAQQICFARDPAGHVDTNRLLVPVLKIYDDLMKHDVISKRRWNGKSLEKFGDLVGTAEYLEFDIKEQTVRIKQVDYIDSTFTTIEENKPNQVINLKDLAAKSLDAKFYNAILDYGMRHQVRLAERANSKISAEFKAKLKEAQDEYIASH